MPRSQDLSIHVDNNDRVMNCMIALSLIDAQGLIVLLVVLVYIYIEAEVISYLCAKGWTINLCF